MSTANINRTDDGSAVISSQTLARGSVVVGTFAQAAKLVTRLLIRIGRQGTTALTNGVDVIIRPSVNANAKAHPQGPVFTSQTAAAVSTTVDTDSASGQKTLQVLSSTGFAAGDMILIGGGTAREEWARISKVVGASHDLVLDRNLEFSHTAVQADTVRNKADVWTYDVTGPGTHEVIVDYGDDSAGDSVTVEVLRQSDDSINIA